MNLCYPANFAAAQAAAAHRANQEIDAGLERFSNGDVCLRIRMEASNGKFFCEQTLRICESLLSGENTVPAGEIIRELRDVEWRLRDDPDTRQWLWYLADSPATHPSVLRAEAIMNGRLDAEIGLDDCDSENVNCWTYPQH